MLVTASALLQAGAEPRLHVPFSGSRRENFYPA